MCVSVCVCVYVCVNRNRLMDYLPGGLSVCSANKMLPITPQASLAANQIEMGKLRADDGVLGHSTYFALC